MYGGYNILLYAYRGVDIKLQIKKINFLLFLPLYTHELSKYYYTLSHQVSLNCHNIFIKTTHQDIKFQIQHYYYYMPDLQQFRKFRGCNQIFPRILCYCFRKWKSAFLDWVRWNCGVLFRKRKLFRHCEIFDRFFRINFCLVLNYFYYRNIFYRHLYPGKNVQKLIKK